MTMEFTPRESLALEDDLVKHLTSSVRQAEALYFLCKGLKYSEIAEQMGCSESTVKRTVYDVCQAFPVKGRVKIVLYALHRPRIVEAMKAARRRARGREAK